MKMKKSQRYLMAMILLSTTAYPLMQAFHIWGLTAWLLALLAFAVAGSLEKTKEQALQKAAK